MKQCPYCAKKIGYHEFYCSEECEKNANAFYEKREKTLKFFSVINGIFVLGIGVCLFVYTFFRPAAYAGAACFIILGVMYMFLPFPADVMIEKYKLKKSIFITRIIAAVMLVIGAVILLLKLLGVL